MGEDSAVRHQADLDSNLTSSLPSRVKHERSQAPFLFLQRNHENNDTHQAGLSGANETSISANVIRSRRSTYVSSVTLKLRSVSVH